MKKEILLSFFIAVSATSFAQVKPSFGVSAGITYSGMRGDAVNNLNNLLDFSAGMIKTGSSTGFFGGVYASIPMDETIVLEPGLYYSQKGYELIGALNLKGLDFLGVNAKAKLTSTYIDIPILLKANLGGFQVFAGPQVSYLSSAKLKMTAGILGINLLNSSRDATAQFNRWDMAVTGGIGYKFNNGMNVKASYDYGLSKVDANQNLKSYNQAFKIGIGMNF
ncbi:MAG: porin family protein [Chitinophagaceae bacterium]